MANRPQITGIKVVVTHRKRGSGCLNYDEGDKLLAVSVGGSAVKTYGYDLAGRTTSVVSSSGTTTLGYDYEGRATSITGPGVSQTNTYNGLDTRVGSTTNSVARSFLRDGAYVTDPVLTDGAATYTPGVSERRGTATTYLHSGLKNADAQSSPAQALTGTRQYDAFGYLATTTGAWSGPFGYAGAFGYQEDATGLKLLGHRLYDASTGRFLTRDRIRDGRNWYAYCDSDPMARIDDRGLDWHDPVSVFLDPGFKGQAWVVGEPGKGQSQTLVPLQPGHSSPNGMDVDIVIIKHPNGTIDQYFLPGANPPQDPFELPSSYIIGSGGNVVAEPGVYRPIVSGLWPGTSIGGGLGIPLPVLPPVKFGPGGGLFPVGGRVLPGLGSSTGNLNDDIKKARKNRRTR